jgi:ABC-type multidrug transport system ATPase subunit
VRAGEIHALLGQNGAGKSTLMNTLSGVIPHDSGELIINGAKVSLTESHSSVPPSPSPTRAFSGSGSATRWRLFVARAAR